SDFLRGQRIILDMQAGLHTQSRNHYAPVLVGKNYAALCEMQAARRAAREPARILAWAGRPQTRILPR
ncbi:MAG: hypothetical protein ACKOLA_16415, partial [Spartobacteria bacterium]